MPTFSELAESVLTRGIDAYAETQVARYQPNEPTPNARGANNNTAPEGRPVFDTLAATFTNPLNLMLLAAAGVLVWFLVRR